MDSNLIYQINEAYRHGVYTEETLSEEEMLSIEGWVSQLISEGYDLDDYSDEELYTAYLDEVKGGGKVEYKPSFSFTKPNDPMSSGYRVTPPRSEDPEHRKMRGYPVDKTLNKVNKLSYEMSKLPKGDPNRQRMQKRHDKMLKVSDGGKHFKVVSEQLDLYDIVSEYLVSEGFCDSYDDADVIMANMSEEWRESIVNNLIEEGFVSPYKAPHAHGRSMDNPGRLSPAMKAMDKSDKLQKTEPGSERQKMQTRRSNQLNRMFSAARRV
jgi:hypothetical protein